MKHKALPILVFLLSLLFAGTAFAEQWIHVRVEGSDDELVTVNLPLSLVRSAAAMIPEEVKTDVNEEVRVQIDDLDMDWQDLRSFWEEVKSSPEATFVTVQTRDETMAVKKEGDFLLVQTTESRNSEVEVDIQVPLMVVDALFSGPDGTLDFAAAIDALASYGPGHLVSIRDGDETVRIWIDGQNLAD
ncbi:MAG: hypothetical protein MI919_39730 [Holophagales bacterium]|nr:hypothetical protein [Holophagales bacterium]